MIKNHKPHWRSDKSYFTAHVWPYKSPSTNKTSTTISQVAATRKESKFLQLPTQNWIFVFPMLYLRPLPLSPTWNKHSIVAQHNTWQKEGGQQQNINNDKNVRKENVNRDPETKWHGGRTRTMRVFESTAEYSRSRSFSRKKKKAFRKI